MTDNVDLFRRKKITLKIRDVKDSLIILVGEFDTTRCHADGALRSKPQHDHSP